MNIILPEMHIKCVVKWDGSDIFMAEGCRFYFSTEKVYKVLKKAKITNIEFERTTEFLMSKD